MAQKTQDKDSAEIVAATAFVPAGVRADWKALASFLRRPLSEVMRDAFEAQHADQLEVIRQMNTRKNPHE